MAECCVARLHEVTVARDLGTELEVRERVKRCDRVILNPAVDLLYRQPVPVRAATAPR